MWVLIIAVLWYHSPAVTQVPGFVSQQACEAAAVQVNKKFSSEGWAGTGATEYGQSICVRAQ